MTWFRYRTNGLAETSPRMGLTQSVTGHAEQEQLSGGDCPEKHLLQEESEPNLGSQEYNSEEVL